MVDPEGAFRRLISRFPSNFVSVDPASVGAAPQFSSTDHLSSEAVAAFVDGELRSRLTCGPRATWRPAPSARRRWTPRGRPARRCANPGR